MGECHVTRETHGANEPNQHFCSPLFVCPLFTYKVLFDSPGHNQNWIYSDVIELYKMAPTFRDAIRGHFSARFWALKCSRRERSTLLA